MKILLTFCFLLSLVASDVTAQHTYIPIPEDSAVWISINEDWHEGEGNVPHTFRYEIGWTEGQDTVVDGTTYFCMRQNLHSAGLPIPYNVYPAKASEWMRQDTVLKKVLYRRTKNIAYEETLYDFSLNEGDTITDTNHFFFYQHINPYKAWVETKDSIFWQDGTWRYRWFIKSNFGVDWGGNPPQAVQIEGMGYTTSFIEDPFMRYYPPVINTEEMTCFKVKDLWLYEQPNLWNVDCDTLLAGYEVPVKIENYTQQLEKPVLYPNPVSSNGWLNLNYYFAKPSATYSLTLYNYLGYQMFSKEVSPGSQLNLSSYKLPQGIYLARITNKEQTIYSGKLIVQ